MNDRILKNPFIRQKVATIALCVMLASVLFLTKCHKIITCDESLKIIALTLKYPDEQPVQLDSSKILWVGKSRFLEQNIFSWNEYSKRGWYVIVDDGMKNELRNKRETMRFTGYLNGEVVHQQDVRVGANRCHVEYLGKEPLVQVVELNFESITP